MGAIAVHVDGGASLFARRLAGRLQRDPGTLDGAAITVCGERGACATATWESGSIVVRDGGDDRSDAVSASDLPPMSTPWQELATLFWEATSDRKGTPDSLRLVATDASEELVLGSAGASYEIHGEAPALAEYLTGQVLLIDLIDAGRIQIRGTLPQLSVMVGNGMAVVPHG